MWHEAIAKRGGNEVASCLYEHLKALPVDVKNITFWSDSCFGQNKNSFVALMFAMFVSTVDNIETIDHKFLVPGHTHMECDVDHSVIERKKKRAAIQIHHPRDWYQFVRTVGVSKSFHVHEMLQSSFKDFGLAAKTKCTFRKFSEENEPFNWRNVKWLRYTKEFGKILYKNTLNIEEPFQILNIFKRGLSQLYFKNLTNCYNQPVNISDAKKRT